MPTKNSKTLSTWFCVLVSDRDGAQSEINTCQVSLYGTSDFENQAEKVFSFCSLLLQRASRSVSTRALFRSLKTAVKFAENIIYNQLREKCYRLPWLWISPAESLTDEDTYVHTYMHTYIYT
jgi:hypothetical protein